MQRRQRGLLVGPAGSWRRRRLFQSVLRVIGLVDRGPIGGPPPLHTPRGNWILALGRPPGDLDRLERAGRALAVGLAAAGTGLVCLGLAEWFHPGGVAAALVAGGAGGVWAARGPAPGVPAQPENGSIGTGTPPGERRGDRPSGGVREGWPLTLPPNPARLEALALVVLLAGLAFWYLPPAEFVLGGLDPGAYANAAVALAATGGFRFPEPLLAAAGPAAWEVFTTRSAVLHSALHPGFYWDGAAATPQFPLLLTAWSGALALPAGVSGALLTPSLAMLVAVFCCHLLARRFLGPAGGLAAAALLGSHPLAAWHARLGLAEGLVLGSLLAGLWAGTRWRATGDPRDGLAAGLSLGLLCLVKTEAAVVGLMAGGCLLFWPGVPRSGRRAVLGGWLAAAVPAALVYATLARPLVTDQLFILGGRAPAGFAALVAAGTVLVVGRRALWHLARRQRQLVWAAAGVGLALGAALLLAQRWGRTAFLLRALWDGGFLTAPDVALAALGAAWWAARGRGAGWGAAALLAAALLYLGVYYRYTLSADRIPLFMWATRRLVPAWLPLLALSQAGALATIARAAPPRWSAGAWAVALAALLAARVATGAVVSEQREYQGAVAGVARLAALTEPDAVLLLERDDTTERAATPLRYLHGRAAYLAWNPGQQGVDAMVAAAHAAGRPVYFVTAAPGALALMVARYRPAPAAAWEAVLPELERTSAHPPGRWNQARSVLTLHRLADRGG